METFVSIAAIVVPYNAKVSGMLNVRWSDWLDGGLMYWVICEAIKDENVENCCHRWIAFPATQESLEDVIEIASLGGGKIFVTKEVAQ